MGNLQKEMDDINKNKQLLEFEQMVDDLKSGKELSYIEKEKYKNERNEKLLNSTMKENQIMREIEDRKQIIEELKRLKWHVGMVFDQTALLVYPTRQELETCFWSTSLDFKCL